MKFVLPVVSHHKLSESGGLNSPEKTLNLNTSSSSNSSSSKNERKLEYSKSEFSPNKAAKQDSSNEKNDLSQSKLSTLERLPVEILQKISIQVGIKGNNLQSTNKYLYKQLKYELDPDQLIQFEAEDRDWIWPRADYVVKSIIHAHGMNVNSCTNIAQITSRFSKLASTLPHDYHIGAMLSYLKIHKYAESYDHKLIDTLVLEYNFITPLFVKYLISKNYRFIDAAKVKEASEIREKALYKMLSEIIKLLRIDYETHHKGWEGLLKTKFMVEKLAKSYKIAEDILFSQWNFKKGKTSLFPNDFINHPQIFEPKKFDIIIILNEYQDFRFKDCEGPLTYLLGNQNLFHFLKYYQFVISISMSKRLSHVFVNSFVNEMCLFIDNPSLDVLYSENLPITFPDGEDDVGEPEVRTTAKSRSFSDKLENSKINKAWYFAVNRLLKVYKNQIYDDASEDYDDRYDLVIVILVLVMILSTLVIIKLVR